MDILRIEDVHAEHYSTRPQIAGHNRNKFVWDELLSVIITKPLGTQKALIDEEAVKQVTRRHICQD